MAPSRHHSPRSPGVIRRRAENSEAPAIERWCARSPDRPPPGGLRGLRRVIRRRAKNSEAPATERWCARSPDRPPPGGLRGLRRRPQTPGGEQRSAGHRALVRTKPRSSPSRGIEGVTIRGYEHWVFEAHASNAQCPISVL